MTTLLDDAAWILSPNGDESSKTCSKCKSIFNLVKKAHTCKTCHFKFCGACSRMKGVVRDRVSVNERACDGCIATMTYVSSIDQITDNNKPYILDEEYKNVLNDELEDENVVIDEDNTNQAEKSTISTPLNLMNTLGRSPLLDVTNNMNTPSAPVSRSPLMDVTNNTSTPSAPLTRSPLMDITNNKDKLNTPTTSVKKTSKLSTQKSRSDKKKISPEVSRITHSNSTAQEVLSTPTNSIKSTTRTPPSNIAVTPSSNAQSPSNVALNRLSPNSVKKSQKKQSDIFKFKVYLGVLFIACAVLAISLIYKTVTTVIIKPVTVIDEIQLQQIDGSMMDADDACGSTIVTDIDTTPSDDVLHNASVIKIDNFVTVVSVILNSNKDKIVNFIKLSSPYSEYIEL